MAKSGNSDSQNPQQVSELAAAIAEKMPSNVYFGVVAEVLGDCNEQIVMNYANALLNKELEPQSVAEATAAFFDHMRFNARR